MVEEGAEITSSVSSIPILEDSVIKPMNTSSFKPDQWLEKACSAVAACADLRALEALRVQFLGKKGEITALLKGLGALPPEDRSAAGQMIHQVRAVIEGSLAQRLSHLQSVERAAQIAREAVDVTLPGRKRTEIGGIHPITQMIDRIVEIFSRLGFDVVEGVEVENEFYNFTALNTPEHHPARAMHDTFYLEAEGLLLRSHTSPVQIHAMRAQGAPLRVLAPGKAFRCDSDLTHTPMFHQMEGLCVDRHLTLGDLKGIMSYFLQTFFGVCVATRFRPSYFPFTEPSAEVDISCIRCEGRGCRICKQTGWLEVLGCGMVHPNVLTGVKIDPEQYTGFAFGAGIERLAMLYYGIPDIRLNFENNLAFLEQFNIDQRSDSAS
jgi:phenylalanyl-tRNA synthetase alpha chain